MISGNVSRAPTSVSRWVAAVIRMLQDISWLSTCCRWLHKQGLRLNTWHWFNWQAEDKSVHSGASCSAETPPPVFCNSNSGLGTRAINDLLVKEESSLYTTTTVWDIFCLLHVLGTVPFVMSQRGLLHQGLVTTPPDMIWLRPLTLLFRTRRRANIASGLARSWTLAFKMTVTNSRLTNCWCPKTPKGE